MSPEFWLASVVVTATPGTGALFTIAAGLTRGARAGLVAALGCTLGIVPHLVLAVTGGAAVIAASRILFEAITWLGIAYLLVMAWGTWRQAGALAPASDEEPERGHSAFAVIRSGVLVNVLNPKLTLFFLVFLPLFVDPDDDAAVVGMAALGGVFMAITLVIFALYGAGAAWLRRAVVGRPRVMRVIGRVFAVSFVGLAVMLALARF